MQSRYIMRVDLVGGVWLVQLSEDVQRQVTPATDKSQVADCTCGQRGCQHLAAVVAHIEREAGHVDSAADLEAAYGLMQYDALRPAKPIKAAPKAKPGRCPHYALIRAFYAVAVERGLDTKADGRIREAMSRYFGFTIWTRADLTATHWELATAGLRTGALAW